jgi:hypothetical protein
MPFVDLTIARTNTGDHMTDLLAGGASGMDMGTCINGAFSIAQNMRIRHNGSAKISGLAFYIQPYTGTYGGNFSPASDYARLRALGDLGGGEFGLHVCEVWNESVPFTTFFKVRTGHGDSYSTKRNLNENAMYHVNTGTLVEADASAAQAGLVGVNDNSAESQQLGNRALLRSRISLPASEPDGGIRQWDWVFSYVYTN